MYVVTMQFSIELIFDYQIFHDNLYNRKTNPVIEGMNEDTARKQTANKNNIDRNISQHINNTCTSANITDLTKQVSYIYISI